MFARKLLVGTAIVAMLMTVFWTTDASAQKTCPSETTINISSSGYSGAFSVELRRGKRPGSKVVGTRTMQAGGKQTFGKVCPGTYFFAFGPSDSDDVSVTRYFEVTFDGRSYNNPTITVFYSRVADDSQLVGKARKNDL